MIINFKSYEEMAAKPNASDGDVGVIASTGGIIRIQSIRTEMGLSASEKSY